MGHRMLPIAFSPTDPRWAGNEIWDKIGCNLARVRDFCKIFVPIGVFSGMRHRMLPIAFSQTDPSCHGNEIWDKIGYNLACVRDFCEISAPIEGFSRMGHWMPLIAFPRLTPVAMATKFGAKELWLSLYTRYLRDYCIYTGVFEDGPLNAANCIVPRSTPVAMVTKFGPKLAITRLV